MPIAEPEAPLKHAPGAPGIAPSWTSSAKDLVGTSLGPARLWFTLGFGIVNEVYYPRVDTPQIRDLGFIVAGPGGFWSEVKRNQNYTLHMLAPGAPAVEIVHTHVTDASLAHLAGLVNLRQLHIHGPETTAAALPFLAKLQDLYQLDAEGKLTKLPPAATMSVNEPPPILISSTPPSNPLVACPVSYSKL